MASILVVDDEASIRYVLRIVLEDAGHDVEEAADGNGALAAIEARRPDLISTDFMMPGMNGAGLIATVRGDPETAHIPIVMISSSGGARDVPGVDFFMGKPFDPDAVVKSVTRLLKEEDRT